MNKEWFIFKGTHHQGPFSLAEMAAFYEKGELTAQTLVWKEGAEKWEALVRTPELMAQLEKSAESAVSKQESRSVLPDLPEDDMPPLLPPILGTQKSAPAKTNPAEDLPPPIPLDALLDSKSENKKMSRFGQTFSKAALALLALGFIVFVGWFITQEMSGGDQIKIKGIMPVYLERLQETAGVTTPAVMVSMALSLDGKTLWVTTNKSGTINTVIKLSSLPKRILGSEEVGLTVKGVINNHLGRMDRMVLTAGKQFVPGEYKIQFTGKKIHFLNEKLKFLSNIPFFKKLNSTYTFQGDTLIYAGTPREFEKKLLDYRESLLNEKLRPYHDKLERLKTFSSLLQKSAQEYFALLAKMKKGSEISAFEVTYMSEVSPIVQSLVGAAYDILQNKKFQEEDFRNPIAPYKEHITFGKLIGELASDMITETKKVKTMTEKQRAQLTTKFGSRYSTINSQIDINIRKLEAHIKTIN